MAFIENVIVPTIISIVCRLQMIEKRISPKQKGGCEVEASGFFGKLIMSNDGLLEHTDERMSG